MTLIGASCVLPSYKIRYLVLKSLEVHRYIIGSITGAKKYRNKITCHSFVHLPTAFLAPPTTFLDAFPNSTELTRLAKSREQNDS